MRVLPYAVIAVLAALSPQIAAANDSPLGRWHGTYDCQQVTATADVDIWNDDTAPGGMRGRFAFSPGPSGQGATGSFWVTVESEYAGWKLVPDQWEARCAVGHGAPPNAARAKHPKWKARINSPSASCPSPT